MKHTARYEVVANDEYCYIIKSGTNFIASTKHKTKKDLANVQLICEAFNVANETGFTPRQLADQNKELREAIKIAEYELAALAALKTFRRYWPEINSAQLAIEEALKTPKL